VTTLPLAAPPVDPVSCALCGFEYTPGGDSCRERGCPIAFGTCATRHCPNCGYTMPDEQKSSTLGFLRSLLGRREPMAVGTVAELPTGTRGVVARLEGDPELLTRLTAQGFAPGVAVHLLQRSPTYVIEMGETTIALERRVAEAIILHDPDGRG
jgi:Fe2+ transport system protein FeoA